jgi:hypothetical protein
MPRYFFHLAGELEAHDLLGRDCENDDKAKEHANALAHRVGTDKPGLVRDGNFIQVKNELGEEIYRLPLASALV